MRELKGNMRGKLRRREEYEGREGEVIGELEEVRGV